MPRVSRAQAEQHREAITEVSSRLFRERGLNGVSVADLMGAAGLTHGGFYGHFASKDALAGIAARHAFEEAIGRWHKRVQGRATAAEARAALVEGYLRPQSVKDVAGGCPTAGLCVDVAREPGDAAIRGAYVEGLEEMVAILAAVESAGDDAADRRAALADYATMLGAMLMARATAGHAIADEILEAARERLVQAPRTAPARRRSRETDKPSERRTSSHGEH